MTDNWQDRDAPEYEEVASHVNPEYENAVVEEDDQSNFVTTGYSVPKDRTVRMMSKRSFDGRRLISDDQGKYYLVNEDQVQYTFQEQNVVPEVLQNADAPYDWNEEIESWMISSDQIRQALWKEGMVTKQDITVPQLMQILLQSGIVPLRG